jgi:hypothetical protein
LLGCAYVNYIIEPHPIAVELIVEWAFTEGVVWALVAHLHASSAAQLRVDHGDQSISRLGATCPDLLRLDSEIALFLNCHGCFFRVSEKGIEVLNRISRRSLGGGTSHR